MVTPKLRTEGGRGKVSLHSRTKIAKRQTKLTFVHVSGPDFVVVKVDIAVDVSPARVGREGVGQGAAQSVKGRVGRYSVRAGGEVHADIGGRFPGELEAESGDGAPGVEGIVHGPEGSMIADVGRGGGRREVLDPGRGKTKKTRATFGKYKKGHLFLFLSLFLAF